MSREKNESELRFGDSAGFLLEDEPPKPSMLEFVLEPPTVPILVLQCNFDCDDICERNIERTYNKMPTYWTEAIRKVGSAMIHDVFDNLPTFKNVQKLAAAEIFFYTLKFFVNTKIADPKELVDFFEEQLLRYSVEHIPKSVEIFDIPECFLVLDLFNDLILQQLALLRALTSNNHIVKLEVCDPELFVKKVKQKKK